MEESLRGVIELLIATKRQASLLTHLIPIYIISRAIKGFCGINIFIGFIVFILFSKFLIHENINELLMS